MYESGTPSKITILKIDDFTFKSGMLAANATLLSKHLQYLGTFNYVGLWSDKTKKAIEALVSSIEADMASEHFGDGNTPVIDRASEYEEAVVHEHVEYLPDDEFDLETQI